MKSERRHELQHNVLADQLAKTGEAMKPYANVLLGGVLLIVIIAIGWTLMARQSSANAAHAWDDFYAALGNQSFTELENIVEHYPGTEVAQWASVAVADLRLTEGCDELYTSRAGADQDLNKAKEQYEAVLAKTKNPLLREKATFGMARVLEAQNELDEAIKYYKKLTEAKGLYTEISRSRISDLEKKSTVGFYKTFAKFDPKPAFRDNTQGPLQFDNLDNLQTPSSNEPILPTLDPISSSGALDSPAANAPIQPPKDEPSEAATPETPKDTKPESPKQ